MHVSNNGLGQSQAANSKSKVEFILQSHNRKYSISMEALTVHKVTCTIPPQSIQNHTTWKHINNLNLADPHFYQPNKIDLLIGADLFADLVMDGNINGTDGASTAQNTHLGWILSGKFLNEKTCSSIHSLHITTDLYRPVSQTFSGRWRKFQLIVF